MRILILEHEPQSPPGYLADWAHDRGYTPYVLKVPGLEQWPEVDGHDVIVSLGSDCSVHASPEPWITDEIAFVRAAHAASVPVFGICFGAQLLAAALGGQVRRAPTAVAAWREVPTLVPQLISRGPWFRWHQDVFELPPRARLLSGTETEPLGYAAGSSVGLQFHPEVGRELAEAWIDGGRAQLSAQGVDEPRLRAEVEQSATGACPRAFSLFDRIAASYWSSPKPRTQRRSLRSPK